jgi:glycosyltransferase involved in cell wall biosynthesis
MSAVFERDKTVGTSDVQPTQYYKFPLVTVVIINWNYSRYVGGAIASVKRQDYPNFECLVVDNGSTDDSVAIIAEAIKGDSRFSLRQLPKNFGHLGAALQVLDTLQGKFINFLDADDILFDNFLSSHVQVHLATSSSVSFTSSEVINVGSDDEVTSGRTHYIEEVRRRSRKCLPQAREPALPTVSDADYSILRDVTFDVPPQISGWCWSPGSANVIRRELLFDFMLDCPDAPLFGGLDGFFLIPLFAITGTNIIGKPLSVYRIHGSNTHARIVGLRGIRPGNEAAHLRNSAIKKLSLLNLINASEQVIEIVAPPIRYFRVLEIVARNSVDSIFIRDPVFAESDVKRALAAQYLFLVKAFGERTVIRELRWIMKFKHLAEIIGMAYGKRIPFATLRRLCSVGIRKRRRWTG